MWVNLKYKNFLHDYIDMDIQHKNIHLLNSTSLESKT